MARKMMSAFKTVYKNDMEMAEPSRFCRIFANTRFKVHSKSRAMAKIAAQLMR